MSYVSANTVWLAPIAPPVQRILALFYELADDKNSNAGPRMAAEVFAEDALLYAAGSTTNATAGSAAIAQSREHAWDAVESRRHTIERVFGSTGADIGSQEIMLIGSLDTKFKNGQSLVVPFTAHAEVVGAASEAPRIKMMRVYAVSLCTFLREHRGRPIRG